MTRPALLAYALFVAIALLILYLSLVRHPPDIDLGFEQQDKPKHALAYATFAATLLRALRRQGFARGRAAAIALAAGAVYGGAIELIQPSFGRTCELLDEVADVAGSAIGVALFALLVEHRPALARRFAVALAAVSLIGPSAGCASQGRADPRGPEARLLEQARIVRARGEVEAREIYASLYIYAKRGDRGLFAWLLARLETDRDRRRAALDRALMLAPELAPAALDLGDLDLEEGFVSAAQSRYRVALAGTRSKKGMEESRARALARLGRLDPALAERNAWAALAAHERAGVRIPDPFVAWAATLTGHRDAAERIFAEAEALAPEDPLVHVIRGQVRLEAGDPCAASADFERALAHARYPAVSRSAYVAATTGRVVHLLARGCAADAEEIALVASERDRAVPLFPYAAALAAIEGNGERHALLARARAHLSKALACDAPGAPAGHLIALLLERSGHPLEAAWLSRGLGSGKEE